MNPYEVLGVPQNADKATVKKAYIELTKKYHPDQYVNHPLANLAEEKMKEINAAYQMIMDGKAGGSSYSDNRGGSGGYDGGFNTYSEYRGQNEQLYAHVRDLIARGKLDEADIALDDIREQGAEWCYLKGSIALQRGYHDEALRYFRHATELEPNNFTYRSALNGLLKRNNAYMYNSNAGGYGGNPGSGMCECCTTLMCLDCLCRGGCC